MVLKTFSSDAYTFLGNILLQEQEAALSGLDATIGTSISHSCQELEDACKNLNLLDLNYILYRCREEELSEYGTDVYDIPDYGPLPYAGLQGNNVCDQLLIPLNGL